MSRAAGFGALFGFVLSRAYATDYDAIHDLFTLRDLHLAGVIGVAIAISALGFAWVRRTKATSWSGAPIILIQKPMTPGLVLGSLTFGIGWALSGACPGTSLAQVGEGKLAALATVAGMLFASRAVELWQAPSPVSARRNEKAPPVI